MCLLVLLVLLVLSSSLLLLLLLLLGDSLGRSGCGVVARGDGSDHGGGSCDGAMPQANCAGAQSQQRQNDGGEEGSQFSFSAVLAGSDVQRHTK